MNRLAETAIPITINPGEASALTIRNVLVALSRLNVAAGGDGLLFEVDGDDESATTDRSLIQ